MSFTHIIGTSGIMVTLLILNFKLKNKMIACTKHYFLPSEVFSVILAPTFFSFPFHLCTLLTLSQLPATAGWKPALANLDFLDTILYLWYAVALPEQKGIEYNNGKSLKFGVRRIQVKLRFFHSLNTWDCNYLIILDFFSSYVKKEELIFYLKVH